MSMYTQLLEAAWNQHPVSSGRGADAAPDEALEEVLRRRRQLDSGLGAGEDDELVPAQLALQIGYDVALMDLARCVGIETEPGGFEQPQRERERLEHELQERGFPLEAVPNGDAVANSS
jgi:hypothetical protein